MNETSSPSKTGLKWSAHKRHSLVSLVFVLFAAYAPFFWILFLTDNQKAWMDLWPTLPGFVTAYLLFAVGLDLRAHALEITIALSVGVFFLLLQFQKFKIIIGTAALIFFTLLSVVAYLMYLA